MTRDPMAHIEDAPLFIVPRVLAALRAFPSAPRFEEVPGPQRAIMAAELDSLTERLLAGIERHPTRFWVIRQFQQSLDRIECADSTARDRFGRTLGELGDILGVEWSAVLYKRQAGDS